MKMGETRQEWTRHPPTEAQNRARTDKDGRSEPVTLRHPLGASCAVCYREQRMKVLADMDLMEDVESNTEIELVEDGEVVDVIRDGGDAGA